MNHINCKYNFSTYENISQYAKNILHLGNPALPHDKHQSGNSKYDGWNPLPWYEQKGYNISNMHLAPDNISAMGRGLVRTSGTMVRPEELAIVLIVLLLWAMAISLFINRWGKIRLMEPYQPNFEGGPHITPTPGSLSGAPARPSICHLTQLDRRPSIILMQCIDETQTNIRKNSQPVQHSSNLSVHLVDGVCNIAKFNQTSSKNLRLNFPEVPERRSSLINLFHNKANGSVGNLKRLKGEQSVGMNNQEQNSASQILKSSRRFNQRRTSLQNPSTFGLPVKRDTKSSSPSTFSLEDKEWPKKTSSKIVPKIPKYFEKNYSTIRTLNESKESLVSARSHRISKSADDKECSSHGTRFESDV